MNISVGKLRQNPTEALDEVESGREVVVTRNNREVAKLIPIKQRKPVTAEDALSVYRDAPLSDNSWSNQINGLNEESVDYHQLRGFFLQKSDSDEVSDE